MAAVFAVIVIIAVATGGPGGKNSDIPIPTGPASKPITPTDDGADGDGKSNGSDDGASDDTAATGTDPDDGDDAAGKGGSGASTDPPKKPPSPHYRPPRPKNPTPKPTSTIYRPDEL